MDVVNPTKMSTVRMRKLYMSPLLTEQYSPLQIKAESTFVAAVNIPAYDIGTIDTELDITFPGSDYAGELGDMG